MLHKLGASTIDGATYTVDNVGNRMSKGNSLTGAMDNYTYDSIYQLTQVVQTPSGGSPGTTETYSYDPVGNRLSSLGVSPYSYNVSNQLTSIAGSPGTTFTYDNNGNTKSKTDGTGTTVYAWDFENRLTSVTLPGSGGTVSFKYDPLGRRVQKATASATTVYAYDGANIAEETNVGGSAQARFAMGLRIDEPLAQLRSGATSSYHADGLGSVTSLTNSAGAVAATYTYDAFGNLAASSGSVTNPFRYTARELDVEIGLYFYRARYYDTMTGRFVSADPVGFTDGPNLYRFVNNSPSIRIDPSGLTSLALNISKGELLVIPEREGHPPYIIPVTSGKGGCMNQPSCASKSSEGPIPPAFYTLQVSDIDEPNFARAIVRELLLADWGSFRAKLNPIGPAPFNRTGFYLHGGMFAGSAGCIDVGGGMFGNDVTNKLLEDLRADPDGKIPLVVFRTAPQLRFNVDFPSLPPAPKRGAK